MISLLYLPPIVSQVRICTNPLTPVNLIFRTSTEYILGVDVATVAIRQDASKLAPLRIHVVQCLFVWVLLGIFMNRWLWFRHIVIETVAWMIAMLTTELESLVVSVTPLVVDSFNKEEIVKLPKGMVEHELGSSIIVDFISRVTGKVIKDSVETASA
jgi:hypothetical protein